MVPFPRNHQRRAGATTLTVFGSALVVFVISACSPDVTVVVAPTTAPTTKGATTLPVATDSTAPTTGTGTSVDTSDASATTSTTGPLQPGETVGTPATSATPGTPTTIVGSGAVTERPYALDGFRGVSASNGFRVTIIVAETFSVVVSADDNVFERLDVSVDGDTLVLGVLPETSLESVTLTATVTLPSLVAIHGSGGSVLSASGACDELRLGLSGGSELDAPALSCRNVEIDLAGGSRADVTASGAIEASLSGGSELTYGGGASQLSLSTSGGSSARSR